ncbi:MBL fold metallo-hydrolase [Crossiella sp. CA198]|uniref:MBL fold metallo-hydrolase n=1 Tax=Crossiella sp. CA198 TaxID=3455607 RepID=UPI003F8D6933
MELRVLGCSGGWPGPGEPCSGYLLTAACRRIWLDAGTGTLPELLRHTDLHRLDALWITHLHADHCSDLAAAFHALAYGPPRAAPLPVFGPPGLVRHLQPVLDEEPAELHRVLAVTEVTDRADYLVGAVRLTAVGVEHGMPAFGVRVVAEGRILGYTGDSRSCPAITDLARDADLLLCEAFLSAPTSRPFTSVMSPEDAGRHASAGGARRLVLTHLHPGADPGLARARAAAEYDGPIEVARPGAVFQTSGGVRA